MEKLTRKEICRRYYLKHKSDILRKNKEYRLLNIDKVKERAKKYAKNNREKINETQRARRKKDNYAYDREWASKPENKLKKKIQNEVYLKNNPQKRMLTTMNYYLKNKKKINAYSKKYRKEHPDYWIIPTHKRRCLGKINLLEYKKKVIELGNKCQVCGISGNDSKLTIDHILPVKHGGTNDIENLQPLCQSCNVRKNAKIITNEDLKVLLNLVLSG